LPLMGFVLLKDARSYRQTGEYFLKKSEQAYLELIRRHPDKAGLKIELARFYYSQRRWQDTINVLAGLSSKRALSLRAMALARRKDYTQALELFNRVEYFADNEYLYLYGLTLEEKNLFSEAAKLYQQIKQPPYYQDAQRRLKALVSVLKKEKLPKSLLRLVKSAPQPQDFPDADSVVLLSEESVQIKGKNAEIDHSHMIVKILNDKGKERWAELHLSYDSTYERIEIEQARVIRPDGRVVYVGKENIRDVSKYLGFPLYSNVRIRIISFPQISQGSIIEYRAKIYRSKLIRGEDFSFTYPLEEDFPILKATFTLEVPQNRRVNFHILNRKYLPQGISLKPHRYKQEGVDVYRWSFENIPQIIPESNMVPTSFVNPAIVISTFDAWDDIYKWWDSLYQDKLSPSISMKNFLSHLLQGAKSSYEKARRIYEFCATKIRYVGVEYGEGGYEPHKAAEVFFNRYGDCKDQAILLVALLRLAKLEAWPVLVPTKDVFNLDKEFPALYFNHAIAAVKIDQRIIFMDPTSFVVSFGDVPLADQGREVLVFTSQSPQLLRIPYQKQNRLDIKMHIDIKADDNVYIRREIAAEGFYAAGQRYYFRFTPPSLIEQDVKEKMRNFSALSKLVKWKILNKDSLRNPPILSYEFIAYSFLSKAKQLRILPVLTQTPLQASLIAKDKRNFPLDLGGLSQVNLEVEIHLGSHFRPEYLPDDLKLDTEWFDLYLNYRRGGAKDIIFKQLLHIKRWEVSAAGYPQFKAAVAKALQILKQQIILEKFK